MSTTESQPLQRDEEKHSQTFCLANIKLIARTLGLITIAVMWIATIVIIDDHRDSYVGYYLAFFFLLWFSPVMWISMVILIKDHNDSYVGYYLIAAATIVTFFEVTWIIDKSACCVREGCCCRIWAAIIWVDNWKKFILYVILSVPLFLEDMRLVLGVVSGLLLIFLGAMYLIKTFRSYVSVSYEKRERQIVSTSTPKVKMVTHEISTQTETSEHHISATYTTTEISEDGGTNTSTTHAGNH